MQVFNYVIFFKKNTFFIFSISLFRNLPCLNEWRNAWDHALLVSAYSVGIYIQPTHLRADRKRGVFEQLNSNSHPLWLSASCVQITVECFLEQGAGNTGKLNFYMHWNFGVYSKVVTVDWTRLLIQFSKNGAFWFMCCKALLAQTMKKTCMGFQPLHLKTN